MRLPASLRAALALALLGEANKLAVAYGLQVCGNDDGQAPTLSASALISL